jgi:hypothetical protein
VAVMLRRTAPPSESRSAAAVGTKAVPTPQLIQVTTGRADLPVWEARLAPWPSEHWLEELRQVESAGYLIVARSSQIPTPLRRGEALPPTRWEMLTKVGSASPGSDTTADTATSPEGVSAFVARVLDQLTLSAWLPAAVLTASVAILLQFRSAKSASVLHAVEALTANPIRLLVIMIPLLVIATIITQAFSFEAIRTLEGYWRRRGLPSKVRTLRIQRHFHKKTAINNRLHAAYEEALDAGRKRMRERGISDALFNALKESLLEVENQSAPVEVKQELVGIEWRDSCNAWHTARIDQLLRDLESYPKDDSRILPTRLGNLIRATEDELEHADDDIEGFVLRYYSKAPRLVQMQHDQFRNRLEMYCTLVFVSASLALLALAILLGSGISAIAVAVASSSFTLLCVASYLAAVASAGGYCAALREMDKAAGS